MNEMLSLLPCVLRTRGNRLYTKSGQRFLDLWQDDGRCILGERMRLPRLAARNSAEKGLYCPYPGPGLSRLAALVHETWPGFSSCSLYNNDAEALHAVRVATGLEPELEDSARVHASGSTAGLQNNTETIRVAIARPFVRVPANAQLALVRFPSPAPFAPACVLARGDFCAVAGPGEAVAPMHVAGATRSLEALKMSDREGYNEGLWARFHGALAPWTMRAGPYLYPKASITDYPVFFRAALSGNTLVSPYASSPSTVPHQFSEGELSALVAAFASAFGT